MMYVIWVIFSHDYFLFFLLDKSIVSAILRPTHNLLDHMHMLEPGNES